MEFVVEINKSPYPIRSLSEGEPVTGSLWFQAKVCWGPDFKYFETNTIHNTPQHPMIEPKLLHVGYVMLYKE
jgi:hypothetical protein